MQYYNRLSLEERKKIGHYLELGASLTKIAKYLNRSKSTISREIKRGKINDIYCPTIQKQNLFLGYLETNLCFSTVTYAIL